MKQEIFDCSDAVMDVCVCAHCCCVIARHLPLAASILAAAFSASPHS